MTNSTKPLKTVKLVFTTIIAAAAFVCLPAGHAKTQTVQTRPDTLKKSILSEKNNLSDLDTEKLDSLFKEFIKYLQNNNVKNKDSLHRQGQISFIPYLGTNEMQSGEITNDFSLNILGGVSKGTDKFELGGLFNIDKQHVKGVQLAGLFNVVEKDVSGSQLAGVINLVGNNMQGFQAAGVANINGKKLNGFQAAGVVNLNSDTTIGANFAGVANITASYSEGLQAAGLFNHSSQLEKGAQFAGLFNSNFKGSIRFQAAGLFNYAHKVKGVQVAPFNFSDSCTGIPIGFFSYVKTGTHQLELSADELFYTNMAFRTGAPKFHTIFEIAIDPQKATHSLWRVGYGIGTSIRAENNLHIDISANAYHISKGNFYTALSEQYKLYTGIEFKIAPKLAIAAGPTFNMYLTDTYEEKAPPLSKTPRPVYNETYWNGINLKGWIGGKIAVRFF